MRAFYHPEQAIHAPGNYMRYGRWVPIKDLPVRTEKLLQALLSCGITPEKPVERGTAPALGVHTPSYVAFLETAWRLWERVPDHGPEIYPSTFPYWSGRPEEPARPVCPADGLLGRVGWHLGDMSVPLGPDSWTSILRATETAAAAAAAVVAGEGAAYALCRPSGHHARADRASGLCYLNNTAIAAQHLRSRFPRVAVIDIDAHHGDGTQQIFYNRPDVLTVSIHADPSDYYPFFTGYGSEIGAGPGTGFNCNLVLPHGSGIQAMLASIDVAAKRVLEFGADALVVALGFDAHKNDPIGVLRIETEAFHDIGERLGKLPLPLLVVQEGGYDVESIGDCLRNFLQGCGRIES